MNWKGWIFGIGKNYLQLSGADRFRDMVGVEPG